MTQHLEAINSDITAVTKAKRGSLIAFARSSGKVCVGQVISSGSSKVGIHAAGLKQNTSIEAETKLYAVTALVTAEVLAQLGIEIPAEAEVPEVTEAITDLPLAA